VTALTNRSALLSAGRRILEPTGGVDILPEGSPHSSSLEATYKKHGLNWERLSADDLPKRFPQFQPKPELKWEAM